MVPPCLNRTGFCLTVLLTALCLSSGIIANSQITAPAAGDTIKPHTSSSSLVDSAGVFIDTTYKAVKQLLNYKKQQSISDLKDRLPGRPRLKRPVIDSSLLSIHRPFDHLLVTRPAIAFNGGYVSYNFNYRSNIDTPYTEKNIAQHQLTGRLNFTVAGIVPLQVNYWVRRSNSNIFKNITDVQLAFDGAAFRQQIMESLRSRLLALSSQLRDSLTEQLYNLKKLQSLELGSWLQNSMNLQQLLESNAILKVDKITYDPNLPEHVNRSREDSLRKVAAFFIDLYNKTQQRYEQLKAQSDSLRLVYENNVIKVQQYERMLKDRDWIKGAGLQKGKAALQGYGLDSMEIPDKYKWLLGIRSFSIGRSPVNYSELTAKNISTTGLNFEYNSWYYVAVSAGLVDYRFRDFAVSNLNRKPQYLYMLRLGIGRLESNYFILSAFRGQKQLFTSGTTARLSTFTVTGYSAEARWQLRPTTYVTGEVATSLSPDYHTNPETKTGFNLDDKTNKAYAVKVYSSLPQTGTRLEGMYKYTGANYQSFSSFQTNAALESWYLKAEQNFFKKRLRINASLRSNEFSNPYIVQQYKSNTVFKSITATFRMRKWPTVSVGYQPMSQLTMLDSQVVENRFQSFIVSGYHQYRLQKLPVSTTLVYNKFYNNSNDTGFVYYNAVNVYGAQSFYFKRFTANIGISHTANNSYALNVLDGGIQLNVDRFGTVGFGAKVNSLDKNLTKTGGYLNASIRIGKQDVIYLSYERGYLPGYKGGLTSNEIGNVQFTKYFGRR